MQPSSRELLTLIQDCANAEEARLLLKVCGQPLSKGGVGWDRAGYYFEAGEGIVWYSDNDNLHMTTYGNIRALLERQNG